MPYYIHREPAFSPFLYAPSVYHAALSTPRLSFSPYPALDLASAFLADDFDTDGDLCLQQSRGCCGDAKCQGRAQKSEPYRRSMSPDKSVEPDQLASSAAATTSHASHQPDIKKSRSLSPASTARRRLLTTTETNEAIVHKIALPDGVTKSDVEISLVKNVMYIKGKSGRRAEIEKNAPTVEKKDGTESHDQQKKGVGIEIQEGAVLFSLVLTVEDDVVQVDGITAATEDEGRVLVLTLPKRPPAPVKRISIQ